MTINQLETYRHMRRLLREHGEGKQWPAASSYPTLNPHTGEFMPSGPMFGGPSVTRERLRAVENQLPSGFWQE